jgi:FkbM family methyltransferase
MALWLVTRLACFVALLSFTSAARPPQRTSVHVTTRHRVRESDYHGLCASPYFSIEELWEGKPDTEWMDFAEIQKQAAVLGEKYHFLELTVDGFPCVEHGCCQHSLIVRPLDSDLPVVSSSLGEYVFALSKLKGWKPTTILDGGGNIGMASAVFAFLYPESRIIAIEPEKENCLLAKYNTAVFPSVRVQCNGLWNNETTVTLKPTHNNLSWGWQIIEAPAGTPGSSLTTSVQSLLKQHNLAGFDYAKIDIEGAEYAVFGENANSSWLDHTQLVSIEIHGDRAPIDAVMAKHGMSGATYGEYTFYARGNMLAQLS